jgi:hypothetical protein
MIRYAGHQRQEPTLRLALKNIALGSYSATNQEIQVDACVWAHTWISYGTFEFQTVAIDGFSKGGIKTVGCKMLGAPSHTTQLRELARNMQNSQVILLSDLFFQVLVGPGKHVGCILAKPGKRRGKSCFFIMFASFMPPTICN